LVCRNYEKIVYDVYVLSLYVIVVCSVLSVEIFSIDETTTATAKPSWVIAKSNTLP